MDWEFLFLNYIQKNIRTDYLDAVMVFIAPFWLLMIVIAIPSLISLFTKKHRRFGRMIICDAAVNTLVCSAIIKPIVNRIRPYELDTTIKLLVPPEFDACFPSGHTFFAFGAATICFIYYKPLGIVMYLFASLIAVSRLYLYMHFPTDVVCGAVFGIICAVIAAHIENLIFSNDPHEDEQTESDSE